MKHNSTKLAKTTLLLGFLFIVSSCTSNTDLSLETNATKIKENLLEYIGSGLEYQSNGKIYLFEDDTSLGAIKVKEENVEGGLFCSDKDDFAIHDTNSLTINASDKDQILFNTIKNSSFDSSNFEINYKGKTFNGSFSNIRSDGGLILFPIYGSKESGASVFVSFDDTNKIVTFETGNILNPYVTVSSFNILDPNNKYIVSENKNLTISSFFSMVGDIEKKSFVNINDNENIDSLEKARQYARTIGQDSLYYDGQFLNGNIEGFYLLSSSGSYSFIDL